MNFKGNCKVKLLNCTKVKADFMNTLYICVLQGGQNIKVAKN